MATLALLIQGTLLLTIAVDGAIFCYILLKRKKDAISTLILLHLFGVLGWATTVFLTLSQESVWAAKLTFSFALVFGMAKYWFAIMFPEGLFPQKWSAYWTLPVSLLVFVITLVDGTLFTHIRAIDGAYISVDNGSFSLLYAVFISYLLIAPLVILFKKYKRAREHILKAQLKFLIWGFALSFIAILLCNELLPVFFNFYALNAVGPSFSLIFVAFMIYVIRNYQFLQFREVIQRGVIFAMLLTLTIGVYLMFVVMLGFLFQKSTSFTILISAGITMLAGVIGAPIVEKYFRRLTNPLFFKDTYDYANAMRELTNILNQNLELATIIRESQGALCRTLKSTKITFLFCANTKGADHGRAHILKTIWQKQHVSAPGNFSTIYAETLNYPNRQILASASDRAHLKKLAETYEAELLVPIMLEDDFLGMLFVGPKRSGDNYSSGDIALLENFSSQIAVAFQKILLYRQVAEHSATLEQKVLDRTREISALREQEHQMIADISHGLQTPLTILKTEIRKLREQHAEIKHVDAFEKSIDMISKFIYDLLTLARLEHAKKSDQSEVIDFSELLEELVEYTQIPAEAGGIRMTCHIDPDIFINGERDHLNEALVNILSNAIKYIGKEKKKEIAITLMASGTDAVLTVQDSGIGISPHDIPHLFERFYRVENAGNRNTRGTGLGLAITKRIIERHGGHIAVVSTLGKGTTFTITIPLLGEEKAQTKH